MDYSWTCSCCGHRFETLPRNFSVQAPLNWMALSEGERVQRAILTSDICTIDP